MLTLRLTFSFFKSQNRPKVTKGRPPPWKRCWLPGWSGRRGPEAAPGKSARSVPRIATGDGPNRIAPRPVPVMWELLPLTEGIFREEITKMKAPDMARSVSARRLAFSVLRMEKNPASKNGMQTTPQAMQKRTGRDALSQSCMALAAGRMPRHSARAAAAVTSFFCLFVMMTLLSFFLCVPVLGCRWTSASKAVCGISGGKRRIPVGRQRKSAS